MGELKLKLVEGSSAATCSEPLLLLLPLLLLPKLMLKEAEELEELKLKCREWTVEWPLSSANGGIKLPFPASLLSPKSWIALLLCDDELPCWLHNSVIDSFCE